MGSEGSSLLPMCPMGTVDVPSAPPPTPFAFDAGSFCTALDALGALEGTDSGSDSGDSYPTLLSPRSESSDSAPPHPADAVRVVTLSAAAPSPAGQRSPLLVRDKCSGRVCRADGQGLEIDTSLFRGRLVVLTQQGGGLPSGQPKRLSMQVQGRFKAPPQGMVYLGGEVDGRLQLGFATRAMCRALIGVAKAVNPRVRATLADAAGTAELPSMSLPLAEMVHSWHQAAPGEQPPSLAGLLPEGDLAGMRQRYRADYPFDPDVTYTFSWSSASLDLGDWQINSVPGISGTSLKTFWGEMPFGLAAYAVHPSAATHAPAERVPVFSVELIHCTHPQYHAAAAVADAH
eukprot:TRINITY_DN9391_c0_g1_i1.p1 TRINITY_DN9391_c0_g1~~TRINITY_DN9391_c0_g1_i1.p1  ORF type:complete len:370 (+),score=111.10 TRINITY_DN9391_c0_g1_i1:77-1111(+)